MKKALILILVVCAIFAISTSVNAQGKMVKKTVTDKKTDSDKKSDTDKKSDSSEDSDKKSDSKSSSGCMSSSSSDSVMYDNYKDDPLYKKMMELLKKMEEASKVYQEKLTAMKEKYKMWNDMTDEERKEMKAEHKEAYDEYMKTVNAYNDAKAEIDAKIEKEMAEKYADNELYKAMIEAKEAYEKAKTEQMEYYKGLKGSMRKMSEEDFKEYEKKALEFRQNISKALKTYSEAKQKFYESISEEKSE